MADVLVALVRGLYRPVLHTNQVSHENCFDVLIQALHTVNCL